jgi:hypothetical protein
MEKNLLRMLAAILTCGSMTLTSCVANDYTSSLIYTRNGTATGLMMRWTKHFSTREGSF